MKPKLFAFPLALVFSSTVMAGSFEWEGINLNSDWTNPTNWDVAASPPTTSPGGWTYPVYGTNFSADFLRVINGTNPGAVYDPGSALTTTFRSGRSIIIGSPADGSLTVSSGTLAAVNSTAAAAGGNDALMANGFNASLTINGGTMDLTGIKQSDNTLRPFHLVFGGGGTAPGISSVITVSSGLLSCNAINLQEGGAHGSGIINLEGSGILSVRSFTRNSAAGGTSTINFNGGTLRAVVATANFLPSTLANTTIAVKSGTTVIDTNGFGITIGVPILTGATPDGGFTKNGAGNLTLSGTNTCTGPVTVNAGTLATASRLLLASDSGAGTGDITLADSYADIQVNNTRNIANDITIANTGDEKTLLLPAPGFAAATFSGPITINETNIDHFRVRADDNCFLTLSGLVSGAGGIFKFQSGRVDLTNPSNNFTGDVKITHGAVSFTDGALGTTGLIRMEGATGVNGVTLRWDPTNDQDISSRLRMYDGKAATLVMADGGTPFDISNVTFANAIGNSTTASLVKSGNGTLTLTQPSTYTGGSTLTQGVLEFANGGLGTSGSVTMNGAILRWATGNTEDISSRIVMVDAKGAAFSTNGNDVTFATPIGNSSTASLTKTNTLGTLTLNGTNTYTGTTTVGGGTLKLAAGATITASASVTLGAAGTLDTSEQATYSVPAGQPLTFGINAGGSGSAGRIAAAGLDVSNATVTYTITGTPDDPVYVLATYTGTLAGTFLSEPAPPTGYTLKYDHEGNKIALVQDAVSGFAAWKAANGNPSGGLGDDHDGDGVDNGTEYFLFGNTSSTGFTALPGVINTAGVLSVTWTKAATGYAGVYGTDFVVETSDTLTGWTPVTPPTVVDPQPAGTVKITGNDVKYIFPTAGPKQFARLKVTGPN